jgi:type 1 glutamine amidotransferase
MRYSAFIIVTLILAGLASGCNRTISVLVITGGHEFDTVEFFTTFDALEGIEMDSVYYPESMEVLQSGAIEAYDVLVFYDFVPELPEKDSSIYRELTRRGKPMLFLHHSLCSFQNWEGYMNMVGGRYNMPGFTADSSLISDYRHDIDISVEVTDHTHPVTMGMDHFVIHDEGYSNITILPGIIPLLRTEHPACAPILGWVNTRDESTVVYLMLGHDRNAYQNPAFIQLLNNAIHWLAGF